LPVYNARTMRDQVDRSLMRERLLATLASAFGLAALFLVAIGLYGVVSQWANQRTREIGLRMALGATGAGVRWLVLRQATSLVLMGALVGIPAALVTSHQLGRVLYGLGPSDPMSLGLAASALLLAAALAAYLPARRASRVDPMVALRSD
jgi:ABC-type antimicrobial peptide transport system permease subunit